MTEFRGTEGEPRTLKQLTFRFVSDDDVCDLIHDLRRCLHNSRRNGGVYYCVTADPTHRIVFAVHVPARLPHSRETPP